MNTIFIIFNFLSVFCELCGELLPPLKEASTQAEPPLIG